MISSNLGVIIRPYLTPFSHKTSVTDRETDRQTDGRTADNHNKWPTLSLQLSGRPKITATTFYSILTENNLKCRHCTMLF